MCGKLHLKLNVRLRPIANKILWREDSKDFEKRVKVPETAGNASELDQFCLVRLAHGADIHVSVCVVACLACQNQFTWEVNFLRKSHSLSVCVHASGDLQTDCVQTPKCWSNNSLLLFDSRRSFLTARSRSTRLETRTKESNMCASFRVLNLQWMLGYVHLQPTVILRVVWVKSRDVKSSETLLEARAILTCKSFVTLRYGCERLTEPSSSWFPPKILPR